MSIRNDKMHTGTVSNGTISDMTMTGLAGGRDSSISIYNASEGDDLWFYDDGENAYIPIPPKELMGGIRWRQVIKLSASGAGVAYRIYEEYGA